MISMIQDTDSPLIVSLKYGLDAIQTLKCNAYAYGNMADFEDYRNQEDVIKAVIEGVVK